MKFSYFYDVDKNDGRGARGSEIFVLGLQKFSPCPGRKKDIRKSASVN
jgi:hypothetical protein